MYFSLAMKHRIGIKEEKNGFYSIKLNGDVIAYGLSKDQASFYYRGIMKGIQASSSAKIILEDSIFDIFH